MTSSLSLPAEMRLSSSLQTFKAKLKTHLCQQAFVQVAPAYCYLSHIQCVCVGGGGGEAGRGAWLLGLALVEEELRVSDNIMGLFSLSYCCFSYGTCTLFFLYIVICHICIIFLNLLSLIFFVINVENVAECCESQ